MAAFWAHRGVSSEAPENTVPAFELAIGRADGIELDVQRTRDGHLVVIHDETIDRTSSGSGRVVDLTLDELRRHSFDNHLPGFEGVRLPTLEDVLDLVAPSELAVNIELKDSIELYPGMGDEVARLVGRYDLTDRVLVSSFNHYSLRELRDAGSPLALGLLLSDGIVDPWRYAEDFGAAALHPHWLALRDENLVEACHAAGIAVNVWTVEPAHFDAVAASGVDAIITNTPPPPSA